MLLVQPVSNGEIHIGKRLWDAILRPFRRLFQLHLSQFFGNSLYFLACRFFVFLSMDCLIHGGHFSYLRTGRTGNILW